MTVKPSDLQKSLKYQTLNTNYNGRYADGIQKDVTAPYTTKFLSDFSVFLNADYENVTDSVLLYTVFLGKLHL